MEPGTPRRDPRSNPGARLRLSEEVRDSAGARGEEAVHRWGRLHGESACVPPPLRHMTTASTVLPTAAGWLRARQAWAPDQRDAPDWRGRPGSSSALAHQGSWRSRALQRSPAPNSSLPRFVIGGRAIQVRWNKSIQDSGAPSQTLVGAPRIPARLILSSRDRLLQRQVVATPQLLAAAAINAPPMS
jgi:hypothetical protein